MDIRWLLLIGSAIIAIKETNALCGCALLGKDYCRCDSNIVRPVRPSSCNSLSRRLCNLVGCGQNYSPIGDSCSCRDNIVRPANVRRTLCGCRRLALSQDCNQDRCECQESVPAPCKTRNDYPADAVSLGLAYRLAKQENCNVPESRLCYGFESKPEECAKKIINTNVPEENLWAMNRAILQLKQPNQIQQISEEQFEDDNNEDNGSSYVGYKDIGYCEEEQQNPSFIVQEQSRCSIKRNPLPRPYINGNCRPGGLIVQQQVIYPNHHNNGQSNDDLTEYNYSDVSKEIVTPEARTGCDCGCQLPIIQKLRGCMRRCK